MFTGDSTLMGLVNIKIDNDITCIQETGVASFMRCNIWHVRGRDYDLVIDTGMGLNPLKNWILKDTDRPLKAVCTHSHFDHSGGLHEFSCRLGHRLEANAFNAGGRNQTMYRGDWTKIEIVNPKQHPDFSTTTYTVQPAPLTGFLDEGDVLDLGNRTFNILHLPGHSPGSIGLFDRNSKILFSGDAIYNGQLLDSHPHSDKKIYRTTLERIRNLGVETFHAGHEPSFGQSRMKKIINDYVRGVGIMPNPLEWFNSINKKHFDHYGHQKWK